MKEDHAAPQRKHRTGAPENPGPMLLPYSCPFSLYDYITVQQSFFIVKAKQEEEDLVHRTSAGV